MIWLKELKSEKRIAKILGLSEDKFEVKSEFGFGKKSGNICIELAYKGKPSGLEQLKQNIGYIALCKVKH